MFWTEEVAAKCGGPQIINDSKTPSGRVHVGALRGVLIHDAIFRTLQEKGIEAAGAAAVIVTEPPAEWMPTSPSR